MDLNKTHVDDYLNSLGSTGLSKASINRKRSALSKFLALQQPHEVSSRHINTNKGPSSFLKMMGVTTVGAILVVAILLVNRQSQVYQKDCYDKNCSYSRDA